MKEREGERYGKRERVWERGSEREEIKILFCLFENPQIEIFVDWWSSASSTLFSKLNSKERERGNFFFGVMVITFMQYTQYT